MNPSGRVDRRSFLRWGAGLGLAVPIAVWAQGQEGAQAPAVPGGGGAGQLYNPGAVQQRTPTSQADNDAYLMSLEKTLKCQCGCNLDIYTCRTTDFTCTTSPALHRDIVALRSQGMSADEIRAAFVDKYGEQALMAPKAEGFNLAGYFVPGAVMLAGVAALTAWLLRRQRQVAEAAPVTVAAPVAGGDLPPVAGATPEEMERLRQALREVRD